MSTLIPVTVIDPNRFEHPDPSGDDWESISRRMLAQGDSWFSLGSLVPTRFANLLHTMALREPTLVVNCGKPGAVLVRMVDSTRARDFRRLLSGRSAPRWSAILVSGGGNDLIEAASTGPSADLGQRLLRTPSERPAGDAGPASDFVSDAGWALFDGHLRDVIHGLVRAKNRDKNLGVPLFLHSYTRVQPTGVGPGFGRPPWLSPSLTAFGIPPERWLDVSDELLGRLQRLLLSAVAAENAASRDARLQLVDTLTVPVDLADPDATGSSGDFLNEIHLNESGLRKVSSAWQPVIDAVV
jgi:hypothetical protein